MQKMVKDTSVLATTATGFCLTDGLKRCREIARKKATNIAKQTSTVCFDAADIVSNKRSNFLNFSKKIRSLIIQDMTIWSQISR